MDISAVSCFLLSMQGKGCCTLSDISEEAAEGFPIYLRVSREGLPFRMPLVEGLS